MFQVSFLCSEERPEIKHLWLYTIRRHTSLINRVAIREIRDNLCADKLDSFNVFLRDLARQVGSNLDVSFLEPTGHANESARDLS